MLEQNEIWKDVVGFEGRYTVSSLGRIKNCKTGYILKQSLYAKCYYGVQFIDKGIVTRYYSHRLIAEAFIPNPDNKKDVNHKNGVKTDNRLENLEWATRLENIHHAFNTGLFKPRKTLAGTKTFFTSHRMKTKVYQDAEKELYGLERPPVKPRAKYQRRRIDNSNKLAELKRIIDEHFTFFQALHIETIEIIVPVNSKQQQAA